MSDNRECQKCGDYYTLRQECEPTAYCDLCAQTMLGDAEKQIAQLTKERDDLLDENNMLKLDCSHSESENARLAAKVAEMRGAILKHKQFITSVNPNPWKADFELYSILRTDDQQETK